MTPSNSIVSFGNRHIARHFTMADGAFRTIAFGDGSSDSRLTVDSREFGILFTDGSLVPGSDFVCRGHMAAEDDDGMQRLTVRLDHPKRGIHAEIVYSLRSDDFYMRKRVTLSAAAAAEHPIDRFDAEWFEASDTVDAVAEYQPLFIGNRFFAGLEYPGAANRVEDGAVRLSQFPGVRLGTEPWHSKSAVLGMAPSGDIRQGFLAYVERIRRRNPPFAYWNSGGEFQLYDPAQLRKRSMDLNATIHAALDRLQTNLTIERGVPIEAYVLEPSWHDPDTLYRIDTEKLHGGLAPLAAKLRATKSHLGLWLSPTAPICPALLSKGAVERHGYALALNPDHPGDYPCLSFPPYFKDIKAAVCRHAGQLDIAYYKMDFSFLVCEAEGHGHLATRRHGRETNIDAMIDIMQAAAVTRPGIRLVPTSGMWLSPWWLMHADVIWPHGMIDFNYERGPVSTQPRDWELTLRDQEFHRLLRVEQGRFPLSGMLYMGMGGGPRYNVAGPHESRESFLRTDVYGMARQLKCPERYVDGPPNDLAEDWDAVADTVRWALDRHDRVPDGKMILGEPAQGEVYGFQHLGPEGGVVTLRNPTMFPKHATVPVESLDARTELVAMMTFPYRRCLGVGTRDRIAARLGIDLEPHAVVVVEIRPRQSLIRPVLCGGRHALVEETPETVVYDVFQETGEPLALEVVSSFPLRGVSVDGAETETPAGRLDLPGRGTRQELELIRLPTEAVPDPDGIVAQTFRLDIPDSHTATARILADNERLHPLKLTVNTGGWYGGLPYRVCRGRGWTAYDVELDAHDMNIVRWGFPPEDAPPAANLWLLHSRQLERRRIAIAFGHRPNKPWPELPTPFAGTVHDAVCVSRAAAKDAGSKAPWTDEYAQHTETD